MSQGGDALRGATLEMPVIDSAVEAQIYLDVLGGMRVPSYQELVAVGDYVNGFISKSSSLQNGVRIWSNRLPDGRSNVLNDVDMTHYRRTADPRSWLLSAERRQELEGVLATTLNTRVDDAFELITRQDDAARWLELDQDIRTARQAEAHAMWLSSRHALRRNLGTTATDEELHDLMNSSLAHNLTYVSPAPPLSREDRALADALRTAQISAERAALARAQEALRPTRWQRICGVFRTIMTLGLEA